MEPHRLTWIYTDSPIFFLTLATYERRRFLATEQMHASFLTFAEKSTAYGVTVGRYVLMPEHIHLFASFGLDAINLSNWVKSLKNSLSKSLRRAEIPSPHWQKSFFDHVLRSAESYDEKWEYVRQNPVRAGLVERVEDWKFQGEIHPLTLLIEN
jgi:REP element-mobilizing transposase RayT